MQKSDYVSMQLDPYVQGKPKASSIITENPDTELQKQAQQILLEFITIPDRVKDVMDYLMVEFVWFCRNFYASQIYDQRMICWWFNVTDQTFRDSFVSDKILPEWQDTDLYHRGPTMLSMYHGQQPIVLQFDDYVTEMLVYFPLLNQLSRVTIPLEYQRNSAGGKGYLCSFTVNRLHPNILYVAGVCSINDSDQIRIDSFDLKKGLWQTIATKPYDEQHDWEYLEFDPIGNRLLLCEYNKVFPKTTDFYIYNLIAKTWEFRSLALDVHMSPPQCALWKHYLVNFGEVVTQSSRNYQMVLFDLTDSQLKCQQISLIPVLHVKGVYQICVLDNRLFFCAHDVSNPDGNIRLCELCEETPGIFRWGTEFSNSNPRGISFPQHYLDSYSCAIQRLDLSEPLLNKSS
jgi:hypothetical protein